MFSSIELGVHMFFSFFILIWNKILHFLVRLLPSRYVSYTEPNWPVPADMTNQIIVVTGSNTGIGKESAMQLASYGATVILACRDVQRGEEAAKVINDKLQNLSLAEFPHAQQGKAIFMQLDLSDLHSVWEFGRSFRAQYNRLDILINNAGQNTNEVLPNGLKKLFQVNYLGHYLLFRCLEDLLTSSTGNEKSGVPNTARVINLSSVTHHSGHPNFKLSALSTIHSGIHVAAAPYNDSKLYMNLLTLEINRRYNTPTVTAVSIEEKMPRSTRKEKLSKDSPTKGMISPGGRMTRSTTAALATFQTSANSTTKRSIISLSANPGAVASDIWRHVPLQSLFTAAISTIFLNVHQGAATTVYAATVDEQIVHDYRASVVDQSKGRGKLCLHRDIPYVIPYSMPTRMLALECLGPFAGPRFSYISLPSRSADYRLSTQEKIAVAQSLGARAFLVEFESPEELSEQLWKYSSELCRKILHFSGVQDTELKFLES